MQWNGGAQNSFEEVEQTRNGLNLSWGSLLYVNTKKELATARGSQFASRHYPVKKINLINPIQARSGIKSSCHLIVALAVRFSKMVL